MAAPVVIAAMSDPFVSALNEGGIDPRPLQDRFAIPSDARQASETFISAQDWYDFVEAAGTAMGDPHFGFSVGNRQDPARLPNMDRVDVGSATFSEVLTALVIDATRITTLAQYRLLIEGKYARLDAVRRFRPARAPAQIDGFFVGFMLRLFRAVAGDAWSQDDLRVTICDPGAVPNDALPRRCFLRGDGSTTSFRFPSQWLLMDTDGIRRQARIDSERLSEDFVERFRDILRTRIASQHFTIDQAARLAGLPVRKLQARLRAADTSFSRELNELRCEHAKKLLLSTETSIGSIGIAVGYPDPTGFSRIFKSWTGTPPRRFRKQH